MSQADEASFEEWWQDSGDEWGQLAIERGEKRAARDVEAIIRGLELDPARGERILDVACGLGRHARLLAQNGHQVAGLDYSPRFIAEARRRAAAEGVEIEFFEGDMRQLPFPDASFEVVLCLWDSFGFFDEAGNQTTLDEMARVLSPGGRLLFDALNPYDMAIRFPPEQWHEFNDGTLLLGAPTFDLANGRMEDTWIFLRDGQRVTRRMSLRLYTVPELRAMLAHSGLALHAVHATPAGPAATLDNRMWFLLAHKPLG